MSKTDQSIRDLTRWVTNMWKTITAALQVQCAKVFSTIPVTGRADFDRRVTYANLGKERVMAWVVIATMPVIVLIEMKALVDAGASARFLAEWRAVAVLRLAFLALAVAFLLFGRRPASPAQITKRHHFSEVGFVLFSLVITSLITGLGQPVKSGVLTEMNRAPTPSVGAYLIAAFVFAAFLQMSIRVVLSAYGLSWLIVVTLYLAQSGWTLASVDIINVTFMTILALLLSQAIYATRAKEYLHLRLIELQRKELEQVNAQLLESNTKLRHLSFVDAMTGVSNRRYFDSYLSREWARALREDSPLAIVMLDIDYFKEFNDERGHQAGDQCLARVARCIRDALHRPTDLLARYGGDEFVAVLPNTELEGARRVAERISREVAALSIAVAGSPHRILTVSVGTACRRPAPGERADSLVAAADAALYRAKTSGRNCFVCAS